MANTKRTRTNQSIDGALSVAGTASLPGGIIGGLSITGDITTSADMDVAGDLTAATLVVGGSPVQPAEIVIFNDTKAIGGGDFTSGSWLTRDLNTTQISQSWASLAANQITLSPGTYLINAEAPAYSVNYHQARWRNITDSTTTLTGTPEYTSSTGTATNKSRIVGVIVLAATKTFELQHQCSTTSAGTGLGLNAGLADEIYSIVQIQKLA